MTLKRKTMDADDLMRMQEGSGVDLSDISESESDAEWDDVVVERDTGLQGEPITTAHKIPVKDRTTHIESIPPPLPHHTKKKVTFQSLGTTPAMINALTAMSIKLPTEVQVACIPPLLAGTYTTLSRSGGSFILCYRQRLYRDIQNRFRQNDSVRHTHPPSPRTRSLRYIRIGPYTHSVI